MDKINVPSVEISFGRNNKESLIDDIINLTSQKPINVIDDSSLFLSDIKKPEKKKKKKKSKKSILIDDEDVENKLMSNKEEVDIIDLIEDMERRNEGKEKEEDEKIIDEQKGNYKKLKKENSIKKEFAEELTILYNLLDELTKFSKEIEKDYNGIRANKVRGISKYTNDLGTLVLNSKQNRLAIVKEIANIKKCIADLELKMNKTDKGGSATENNPEVFAAAYLKNVLNYGRQDFINKVKGEPSDSENMIDHIMYAKTHGVEPSDEEYDDYNDFIENRLSDNPYRSEDGNKYIEYENRDVKVSIKKCVDTGEWEFIALDKNNLQIYDYPLPSKRSVGRVKFSTDGNYATDGRGIMYNVIEYFLPDGDEDYDYED